jgi:hypothetical protein
MSGASPERHEHPRARILENPFYVLALRPNATRVEVERQGQKLMGMLELGLASAATYITPIGPAERTTDKVRHALAELRDPERRLVHELWARVDPELRNAGDDDGDDDDGPAKTAHPSRASTRRASDPLGPWSDAFEALGWRPR